MSQLMSRAGNFSCAAAGWSATRRPAQTPSAAPPAFTRKSRRLVCGLLVMLTLLLVRASWSAVNGSGSGQPNPEPSFERTAIQEMCQRHVLRYESGGVNENPLFIALAPLLRAGDELVNFAVQLPARELALLDHALELALQHVEFPAVDHDLVQFRPASRVELAPRQRDEGRPRLEPGLAAHHVARRGAAHH